VERQRQRPPCDRLRDREHPFARAEPLGLSGAGFKPQTNPFNSTKLTQPIDTVVGRTQVALHRMNTTTREPPAVIEGSSHILLADAFRHATDADVSAIRGFRYGTVVPPGPIKLEDLYHFIPIGPQIAKGTIKGQQLRNQIENSIDGSLNPDVSKWTGGWLFNFSGLRADIDPYGKPGERAVNISVFDRATKSFNRDPAASTLMRRTTTRAILTSSTRYRPPT
jgi:sulfur-oxidizing protein SoxB